MNDRRLSLLRSGCIALIVFGCLSPLYGQDSSNTARLIETFLRIQQDTGKIIYSARVNARFLENLDLVLLKEKRINSPVPGNIALTEKEKAFIKNQFKRSKTKVWKDRLFPNAQMITEDTLNKIFYDNSRGWNYFRSKYGKKLWNFSEPVFIRDNSICILYLEYLCGAECGITSICFYKKENQAWKKWIDLKIGEY